MTKTHAPAAAGDFPIELGPAAPVFPPIEFPDGPKAAQSLGLAPVAGRGSRGPGRHWPPVRVGRAGAASFGR